MESITAISPAKINLLLGVLGKRPDGYHDLFTLFQRISLSDRLIVKKARKGITLRCNHPDIPIDGRNLVAKAYELICLETGLNQGVDITIEKTIPVGGGLGGGSSNAASTLLALNLLFDLKLRKDELIHLGKRLGADVPFFLHGVSQALGRGRGDELTPLRGNPKVPILLTLFPVGVSTKEVYGRYRASRENPGLTKLSCDATMISVFLSSKDLASVSRLLMNDLLRPAVQIKPAIGQVLSYLRMSWPASLMSGSGSTLFSFTRNRKEAVIAAGKIAQKFGLPTWVGSTC